MCAYRRVWLGNTVVVHRRDVCRILEIVISQCRVKLLHLGFSSQYVHSAEKAHTAHSLFVAHFLYLVGNHSVFPVVGAVEHLIGRKSHDNLSSGAILNPCGHVGGEAVFLVPIHLRHKQVVFPGLHPFASVLIHIAVSRHISRAIDILVGANRSRSHFHIGLYALHHIVKFVHEGVDIQPTPVGKRHSAAIFGITFIIAKCAAGIAGVVEIITVVVIVGNNLTI